MDNYHQQTDQAAKGMAELKPFTFRILGQASGPPISEGFFLATHEMAWLMEETFNRANLQKMIDNRFRLLRMHIEEVEMTPGIPDSLVLADWANPNPMNTTITQSQNQSQNQNQSNQQE